MARGFQERGCELARRHEILENRLGLVVVLSSRLSETSSPQSVRILSSP